MLCLMCYQINQMNTHTHTQESNIGVLIGNASTLSYLQGKPLFWSAMCSIKKYEIFKLCHKTVALQCRFPKTTNYQDGRIVYVFSRITCLLKYVFQLCLIGLEAGNGWKLIQACATSAKWEKPVMDEMCQMS